MKKVITALMVMGLVFSSGLAQGKLSGYMIGEYYSVLNQHYEDFEGLHGFWLRRIYFQYDNKLTDSIKMRLRFEINSPGDFKTSSTLNPFVKDAYLQFKLGGQDIKAGIQGPPTFEKVEDLWGYRALEKTPLDLLKLRSSRDFGISIKGHLDSGKKSAYVIMYGNGSSNKAETDKGKIIYGSLGFEPVKGLYLEAYGDLESIAGDKTYYVYQGFAAYSGDWGRLGLLYSNKHYDHGETSLDYGVFSVFAVVKASSTVDLIGRFDKTFGNGWEESFSGSKISYVPFANNVKSNFMVAAFSWQTVKNIWLIPNIKYVFYDKPETGEKPAGDIYANFTLWFKF